MKTTVHYPKAHSGNNCSITFPFPLPALRSAHAAMPQRAQLAAKLPWSGISFSNEAFKRFCLCKDARNGLHTKLGRRKGFNTGPGGLRGGCGRPQRARGLARHSARRFGAHGSSPLPPQPFPPGSAAGKRGCGRSSRPKRVPCRYPRGQAPPQPGAPALIAFSSSFEQHGSDTALPPRSAAAASPAPRTRFKRGAAAAPGRPRGCPGPAARQEPGSASLPPALRFGACRSLPPRGKRALGRPESPREKPTSASARPSSAG